jgi:hypothetical protein
MKTLRKVLLVSLPVALVMALVPLSAPAFSAPRTLADRHRLGGIQDGSIAVDPAFPVDFLGVSWLSGQPPAVRFRHEGKWTVWTSTREEELRPLGERTFSALVFAGDADAYQVRGANRGVRAYAINTTDGPRSLAWQSPSAEAAHVTQPAVVSRQGWGADESFRFNSDGSEKWPPVFHATQKLIVHHTATANDDPNPAATVRAIYRYHAIDQGYGDIGYNFLIDGQGRIYKGRYSGPAGTQDQDSLTGENPDGLGVTAAHAGGWNSGTMGIAILGTYTSATVPPTARSMLVDHLAWEAEHHGIDPLATSTFINPVSGAQATVPNISGHRDWAATECPGGTLYGDLPAIRQDVAAKVSGSTPAPDARPPAFSNVSASSVTRSSAQITWSTDEPADSQVEYWVSGSSTRTLTLLDAALVTAHRVALSGLSPRTRYSYRAWSADGAGNRAGSGIYTLRTKR